MTITFTGRLPKDFFEAKDGSLVCPHRDLSCCKPCANSGLPIVEVYGQHYFAFDKAEYDELVAAVANIDAAIAAKQ